MKLKIEILRDMDICLRQISTPYILEKAEHLLYDLETEILNPHKPLIIKNKVIKHENIFVKTTRNVKAKIITACKTVFNCIFFFKKGEKK